MSAADEDKKEPEVEEKEEVKIPAAEEPAMATSEAPSQDASQSLPPEAPPAMEAAPPPQAPSQENAAQPAPEASLQPPPATPEQDAQQMSAHDAAFANDLTYGKIQPKTYQDLYNDRSTLGKLGTFFGLMLSGAGSGVTGQPNMLLHMMDKTIERDFEAQKANQANKQSWYHYSLQHELNQPQIAQGYAQAKKLGLEAEFQEYVNKRAGIKASATGINAETLSYLHNQQEVINKMPPGPQRDQAQNNLNNVVVPAALNKMHQRNLEAAKKTALFDAVNPSPLAKKQDKKQTAADNELVDMAQLTKMANNGDFNSKHGVPLDFKKDIDPSDRPKIDEAIDQKRVNNNNYKDVMDAYNALARMPNAGETSLGHFTASLKKIPWIGESLYGATQLGQGKITRPRDQLLDALAQRLSKNGESAQSVEELKNALSPSMFDSSDTMAKGADLVYQHFNHRKESHPQVLQKYKLDKDLPQIKFDSIAAQKDREGVPFTAEEAKKSANKKDKSFFEKLTTGS